MSYPKAEYKADFKRYHELAKAFKEGERFGKKSKLGVTKIDAKKELSKLEDKLLDNSGDIKKYKDFVNEEKYEKVMEKTNKALKELVEKQEDIVVPEVKINLDKPKLKNLTNEEKSELKKQDDSNIAKIKKLEKAIEDQTKIIDQEIKVTTNEKGEQEIEIKKKSRKLDRDEDSSDEELPDEWEYGKDKKRHKKFNEPDEHREDVSEEYKLKLKNAIMIGKAGGSRKILECPHCSKRMLAAGVKAVAGKKEQSAKQKAWLQHIVDTGKRPECAGLTRPKIVKIAGTCWDKLKSTPIVVETIDIKKIFEEDKNRNSKHH